MDKKVLCICLNPAIDKFIKIDKLQKGKVNRASTSITRVGGKSVNVAAVLSKNIDNITLFTVLDSTNRHFFINEFLYSNLAIEYIEVSSNVRTNFHIEDINNNEFTDILDASKALTDEEKEKIINKVKELININDLIVFSGSVWKGFDSSIYNNLIKYCNKQNKISILDASDDLLLNGIEANPSFIKPNIDELKNINKEDFFSQKEIISCIKKYIDSGVDSCLVSLGDNGSIYLDKQSCYKISHDKKKAVNTVGCGDCLVAGFVYGLVKKLSIESTLQFATRLAILNTMHQNIHEMDYQLLDNIDVKITKIF